jgi:hypothetical protein
VGLGLGAVVFINANQPAFACSIELDPVSPVPGSSALGQEEDDMGRQHVTPGTQVHYTFCPPASGNHVSSAGLGPIAARYYGPDESVIPEGWVHNLEHGALVVAYSCDQGGCNATDQDKLRQLAAAFPASPVCKIAGGILSPVIARFDQMKAPFAAIVWNRVLFQQHLDTAQVLQFFTQYGERNNPEQQCARPGQSGPIPSAMPLPGTSPSGDTFDGRRIIG